ncbi:hypothetical protein GYMLUDRAFT_243994 [Collybiopsis luxurians FD-317 M1]|uniref:ribonuclease H n=1 Tax=Collybiopsis luxurians FD-317 M1 TaxID=944289 RepID=A0A0D0CPM8_9AGAR|nr:hypothetical protein GYMLUDRAFT_243994 [Collybiopsis luxurians FD-317 M1]
MLTDFNRKVHALHSEKPSNDSALLKLYGHAAALQSSPLKVYIDGSWIGNSSSHLQAGTGIYFGPGSDSSNTLACWVTGTQTNNCAEIYSNLVTLQKTPLSRLLEIYTDSMYLIRSLAYWAIHNSQQGDGILDQGSGCPSLTHVHGHFGNIHNKCADKLAKQGALLPPLAPHSPLDFFANLVPLLFHSASTGIPKVYTSLPEHDSPPSCTDHPTVSPTSHWGHANTRSRQSSFLSDLEKAAGGGVSHSGLSTNMFGILALLAAKSGFDADHLWEEKAKEDSIPMPSPPSLHPIFNSDITEDAIATIKSFLKESHHSDSMGVDDSTYTLLMGIDNDSLRDVFAESFGETKFSTAWLRAVIVAVFKIGKDPLKLENYCAIALECCILKFVSLLRLLKLAQVLDQVGIIPPSQN